MKKEDLIKAGLLIIVFALMAIGIVVVIKNLPKQIGEKPIDCRHTDAYIGIVTEYKYIYDIFSEEGFKKVPYTYSKSFPEKWEICYEIEYDNGTTKTEWREVTQQEYEDFLKEDYE